MTEKHTVPQYIENNDAFDWWNVNQFAVHLQPNQLMQVFTRPAKHHLAKSNLKVNALVVQTDRHTHHSRQTDKKHKT